MNVNINDAIIARLKELYQEDRNARRFLDKAASRQREASATSIERIMVHCETDSRADAVKLAKQFEAIECAEFIVGRRGAPSRLEWKYSLISLGRSAAGEVDELQSVSDTAELDEGSKDTNDPSNDFVDTLSIGQAKERLAKSLGIPVSTIEITIKA